MLHKDQTTPGSMVRVRSGQLKSGVPWIGLKGDKPADWDHIDALTFTAGAGSFLSGSGKIPAGTDLKIVKGPKRYDGINTVIVEMPNGVQGHVYWCELRINCDHILPDDNLA